MNKIQQKIFFHSLLSIIIFIFFYYIVRLPTDPLILGYRDDSEALYHTLNIINGGIPYLNDYSHHFLGYLLEYLAISKFLGFSPDLVREVAFFNQVAMGFGVFLCMRMFFSWPLALLSGALAIGAREPWVLGFFIQQQLNLLIVFIIYGSLQYLQGNRPASVLVAFLLAGLLLTFDQRTLLVVLIPLLALALQRDRTPAKRITLSLSALVAYLIPPLLLLGYLFRNNALNAFYEQAIIFPVFYRSASSSLFEILYKGIDIHKYLVFKTPILLAAGMIGYIALWKEILRSSDKVLKLQLILIAASVIPLGVIPMVGGRDYDYYSITWLPYLAMMAVFSLAYFKRHKRSIRRLYTCILICPILLSSVSALHETNEDRFKEYKGDGVREVVDYLKANMSGTDSLYVWGYRMDIYIFLERLSALPFANDLMVNPDSQVQDPQERLKHIYPKYREEFEFLLKKKRPTFLVVFLEDHHLPSPTFSFLKNFLAEKYKKVYEITKDDFRGEEMNFRIYRLKNGQN